MKNRETCVGRQAVLFAALLALSAAPVGGQQSAQTGMPTLEIYGGTP